MTWREKLIQQWIKLRTASEAVGVQKNLQQFQTVRRLIHKTQDGTLGQPTGEPVSDDMLILGDVDMSQNAKSAVPAAIAAGILGAGLGAAGMSIMADRLARTDSPPPVASIDTDTQYELRIVKPEGEQ